MGESAVQSEKSVATECIVSTNKENHDEKPINEESNLDSLKQINCQVGANQEPEEKDCEQISENETTSISKTKDTLSTGSKTKRKSRRRLKPMVNNTSLHFSDTDSEGELTMINSKVRTLTLPTDVQQGPIISVTLENDEGKIEPTQNFDCLSPDENGRPQSSSFVENLTDVDEIYVSEAENETKQHQNSLTIDESPHQAETDLEDFEGDEEVQQPIYIEPRSDILCELSGETIMTKEGDGPFSVEIRNKLAHEAATKAEACNDTDNLLIPNTDEEDMDFSEDDDLQEACSSQKELLEDLDVLAASQIVMRNINKMENTLCLKDTGDDVINDSHTDVEDVE